MPSQSTYSRFFGKFSQSRNSEVFPELQKSFLEQIEVGNYCLKICPVISSCYVTNLDLPLDFIWNIYNGRDDYENSIRELKQDFGLENFCLKDFWVTEASFRFIIVAYNIMSLFRFFALQSYKRSTLKTLKLYCFALGAWTVKHSDRKVLKIALQVKLMKWMDGIFNQIHNLDSHFFLMHNPD